MNTLKAFRRVIFGGLVALLIVLAAGCGFNPLAQSPAAQPVNASPPSTTSSVPAGSGAAAVTLPSATTPSAVDFTTAVRDVARRVNLAYVATGNRAHGWHTAAMDRCAARERDVRADGLELPCINVGNEEHLLAQCGADGAGSVGGR